MSLRKNQKGFTILTVFIGAALLAVGIFVAGYAINQSRKSYLLTRQTLVAETYASELLEFLRSYKSERLRAYLQTNPVNILFTPYPLCAHINLMNRSLNNTILNPDDLATLPLFTPLGLSTDARPPNRFYMIEVVDMTTMQPVSAACGQTGANLAGSNFMPRFDNNYRFQLTVGVTWVPKIDPTQTVKRVVLSTILPEG